MTEYSVFFVSDRTGITVESVGRSLLTQFEGLRFNQTVLPFVDTPARARETALRINRSAVESGSRPVVFSTLIDPEVRTIVARANCVFLDFFDCFIGPLEKALSMQSSRTVGRSHAMSDDVQYSTRMEAVNFALSTDDGLGVQQYDDADVVLIGVSRSGKTPTCLYLAMQFGIRAANYPITEEDMEKTRLPQVLQGYRGKLFGLCIDPERLRSHREERRPDSRYASLKQCRYEVAQLEELYRRESLTWLDTSRMSIEEIATTLLHRMGLRRRLY
jgi:regulator of PEP synthase PpsR (kinase-PPPase family)